MDCKLSSHPVHQSCTFINVLTLHPQFACFVRFAYIFPLLKKSMKLSKKDRKILNKNRYDKGANEKAFEDAMLIILLTTGLNVG